jgi:hypothetical protein
MYNVLFWEITGRKKEKVSSVCFANIANISRYGASKLPERILYKCKKDPALTKDEVVFYCNFLTKLLGKEFSFRDSGDWTFFRLKTAGLSPMKTLLYLTAFRCLCEFADIVKHFCKVNKDKSNLDELFQSLQEAHFEAARGNIPLKYGNLSGHGLMYSYGWGLKWSSPNLISLEDFKSNLIKDNFNRVQSFFDTPPVKQAASEPVKPQVARHIPKRADNLKFVQNLKPVNLIYA